MAKLKAKDEQCDNDYECLDTPCTKNKCKKPNFARVIVNWFKGLFGK